MNQGEAKMMKRIGLAAAVLACMSVPAVAQEHWTEGPVWECSAYRTNPGQFDTYMEWIRAHSEPINAEAKKQGLILDYKAFVKPPRDVNDYDVMFCTLYPSFAKALDFNQGDDDKFEAISAAHWGTPDNQQQLAKSAPRLEMRKFLGAEYVREVNLRPAN
jgi:hypothetical protein